MKFNTKIAKEVATTGGSAIVGAKISKAANVMIPASLKNPAVHGIVTVGAIVVASFITGNGLMSQVGRGLALGVAVDQGNEAINRVAAPMLPPANTTAAKMLSAAFSQPDSLQGYRGALRSYSPQVLQSLDTQAQGPIKINIAG
jgi:hypothetical protein